MNHNFSKILRFTFILTLLFLYGLSGMETPIFASGKNSEKTISFSNSPDSSVNSSFQKYRKENLPSVGRSAFDHLVNDPKSKLGFTIPYPFEKLISKIRSKLKDPEKVSVLFVPFGRSIQKFAADPDYFKYPRTILSIFSQPKNENSIDYLSKLYIGYVEITNKLEVISYNELAGRYEYQVVDNYKKGHTPKVRYIKRKLCLTCHEMSVPILPGEPWSETNENALIARNIIKARGGKKTYFGIPIELEDQPTRGFSITGEAFDLTIHRSNKLIYNHHRRNKLCDPSSIDRIDCISNALLVSLANYFNVWKGSDWKPLQVYKNQVEKFYASKIKVTLPSSFIADRDPVTNNEVNSLKDLKTALPSKNMKYVIALMKSNISHLRSYADPKKSRKTVMAPRRGRCFLPGTEKPKSGKRWCETKYFYQLLDLKMKELMNLATRKNRENRENRENRIFDFSIIEDAIEKLRIDAKSNRNANLAQEYISGVRLFHDLRSAINNSPFLIPGFTKKLSHKMTFNSEGKVGRFTTSAVKSSHLRKFVTYCSSCHSLEDVSYPIQFLNGNSENKVISDIGKHKKVILECLQNKETPMPPVKSEEHRSLKLNPSDRESMIKYLNLIP